MITPGLFSQVLHKNIHCGYSFEGPQRGASNDYPHVFKQKTEKISQSIIKYSSITLVLLNSDILCKQCRSRSVDF